MTFEEWYADFLYYEGEPTKDIAKQAWEAAWDQQQRTIDEMHLQFKDYICPECRSSNFRHKMDCGRQR